MIDQIFTYYTVEMIYLWLNLGVLPFWFVLIIFPQSQITRVFNYHNRYDIFRGLSQGIKCRELKMCPRPKIAGIPTKVCPLRQTFEPCDHDFGRYVTHKY